MPDYDYKADDKESKGNYLKKEKEEKEGISEQKKEQKRLKLNNTNQNGKIGKDKKVAVNKVFSILKIIIDYINNNYTILKI